MAAVPPPHRSSQDTAARHLDEKVSAVQQQLQVVMQLLTDLSLNPKTPQPAARVMSPWVVSQSAAVDPNDAVTKIMSLVQDRDLSKPDERVAFAKILRTNFDIKVRSDTIASLQTENINQIILCITDTDLRVRLLKLLVDIERSSDAPECLPAIKESLFSLMSSTFGADQKACIRKFFTLFETEADQLTLVSRQMSCLVNSYLARLCSNFFDRSGMYDLSAAMDSHSAQMLVNFIAREEVPKEELGNLCILLSLAKIIRSTSLDRRCREQIGIDSCSYTVSRLFDLFKFANEHKIDDLYLISLRELAKKPKEDLETVRSFGFCKDQRAQVLLQEFRNCTLYFVHDDFFTLGFRHADPAILDRIDLTNVECLDFSRCATVRSAIDWIATRLQAPDCTITKLNFSRKCGGELLETGDYRKLATALAHTKSLTELDLSGMRITSSDFTLLFSSMGNDYSLRSLNIENHRLDNYNDFYAVTEKLGLLKKFNMKSSQLCVQEHPDFREVLFNNLKELESFSISDLGNCELLNGNSTLRTVDLSVSELPGTFRFALSTSIAQSTSIKKCIINSPYNNFNFEFIRAILSTNHTVEITLHTDSVDEKLRVLAENCRKFTIVYDLYL